MTLLQQSNFQSTTPTLVLTTNFKNPLFPTNSTSPTPALQFYTHVFDFEKCAIINYNHNDNVEYWSCGGV